MKSQIIPIKNILISFILLYWFPIFLMSFYASLHVQWWLVIMALCLSSFGTLVLVLLITEWEKQIASQTISNLKPPSPNIQDSASENIKSYDELMGQLQTSLIDMEEKKEAINQELQDKIQELTLLENQHKNCHKNIEALKQELIQLKTEMTEQKVLYEETFSENEKKFIDSQQSLEAKQKIIEILENKVNDLHYEIKTILKIAQEQ